MKTKMILFVLVVIAIGTGIVWIPARHLSATESGGRKVLYYTCAMHPWVRESKPGQCPVCGMNLTPIYANESGMAETNSNANSGMVTLEAESISTINVQTDGRDGLCGQGRRSLCTARNLAWPCW